MDEGVELWRLSGAQLEVLAYPHGSVAEARRRVVEIAMLGVEKLVFEGPVNMGGVNVVAKGTTGVVVKAVHVGGLVAVKIRRVDSNRDSLLDEARNIRVANSLGVGPHVIAASRNALVWRFVEGKPLESWILEAPLPQVLATVRMLLDQAFRLDRAGLVHQELSRLKRHVIVQPGGEPVIFDFETASFQSERSNLTQLLQALFIREGDVPSRVRLAFGLSREQALEAARLYKNTRDVTPLRRFGLLPGSPATN